MKALNVGTDLRDDGSVVVTLQVVLEPGEEVWRAEVLALARRMQDEATVPAKATPASTFYNSEALHGDRPGPARSRRPAQ